MSLFRRKDSPYWWVKLVHGGGRVQQSTGTADRRKAQEYHDKLKAALWDQAKLGEAPRYAWQDAVVRYLEETSHKASQADDKRHLRWLDQYLRGVELRAIDRERVDRITKARQAEGVSHASVNRVLEVLRAILRTAVHDWEWLERMPRVRLLPELKRRVRFPSGWSRSSRSISCRSSGSRSRPGCVGRM
jgi:hypothetical protein